MIQIGVDLEFDATAMTGALISLLHRPPCLHPPGDKREQPYSYLASPFQAGIGRWLLRPWAFWRRTDCREADTRPEQQCPDRRPQGRNVNCACQCTINLPWSPEAALAMAPLCGLI